MGERMSAQIEQLISTLMTRHGSVQKYSNVSAIFSKNYAEKRSRQWVSTVLSQTVEARALLPRG